MTHQELENVCNPVINRPKPTVEEAPEANDQSGGSNNASTAKQGAEGKGDAKGSQQTKPGTKEMEVDWDRGLGSKLCNHHHVYHDWPLIQ